MYHMPKPFVFSSAQLSFERKIKSGDVTGKCIDRTNEKGDDSSRCEYMMSRCFFLHTMYCEYLGLC